MPFLVRTEHDPVKSDVRERMRPAHLKYLEENMAMLIAAGQTLSDDGKKPTGSFYILDVDTRAAADAFMGSEPYSQSGILRLVEVTRWKKAIFDRQRVLAP